MLPNHNARYILAIDQGTTGTTALLIDSSLRVVGSSTAEFRQIYPAPGWVEHSGDDIWQSAEKSISHLLQKTGITVEEIAAIGITNQRETTCLFDAVTSAPLHNFIVWQCRRTTSYCQNMRAQGLENTIRQKTGLVLDPYFSGSKLAWLFQNVEGAYAKAAAGQALFGTIDTWLVHKLSGGQVHVTDATNASRTLLMNLQTVDYDAELLNLFGIPRACLPAIKSSSEVYGYTKGLSFLPDGIPIAGIAGDQQAALFGQACFFDGEAKCTYGTGCFLLLNTGERIVHSKHQLLTTVAISLGGRVHYALEGSAFIAGAAVQWLRDGLGMIQKASEIEALAQSVESAGPVSFVPALSGLGAPHWRPDARGVLCGISRDTHKGHIARAALDGIALQNADILRAMQADAGQLNALKVDGGASANNLLMQIQADVLGVPCVRPAVVETTALGAAALAGLAIGMFAHRDEVRKVWREDRVFVPSIDDVERQRRNTQWQAAVARA